MFQHVMAGDEDRNIAPSCALYCIPRIELLGMPRFWVPRVGRVQPALQINQNDLSFKYSINLQIIISAL
jgi:hypothetical protein